MHLLSDLLKKMQAKHNKIKKILVTVPTLTLGGMERAALNYAKMLMAHNVQVNIFLISSDEVNYVVPDDIKIIFGKKKDQSKWFIPLSLYKLRKLVSSFKPDFVLSFSGRLSSYVILSLLGVNSNVIPMHRSNPYIDHGKLDTLLNKMLFPKCKALIVQTKTAKEIFKIKYNNPNIIVIPNPVREILIDKKIEKEKIIVTVSRLVKGKGLERLIRMFKTINNQDWRLFIIGGGYLKNDLKRVIHELSLDDHVILTGFQQNVDYYLSLASIFAFTSESEGYPNALLEAMVAGLPCISFDCITGPSDMIIDGLNGYLVPINDDQQFIEKLQKLMNSKNLRYEFGKEAKKLKYKNSFDEIGRILITSLQNIK